MKTLVLIVCCIFTQVLTQRFNSCPEQKKDQKAVVPPTGKWYQVIKENKNGTIESCFTLTITASKTNVTIIQRFVVHSIELNHTYVASINDKGTWDVKMNGNY